MPTSRKEKAANPFSNHTWKKDLNSAIKNDEMYMMYQPKYRQGQIVGYEALCRWEHPIFGMIPPDLFIEEAEETGFILDVGRFAVTNACQLVSCLKELDIDISVAVNVSPLQLRGANGLDLINYVHGQADALGIDYRSIILEITEGQEIDRPDVLAALKEAKAAGFRLSLDDFGTGYSAYSVFNKLDLDQLKIDRCFVDAIGSTKGDAIIESIIKLAQRLGMEVVAEGVETRAQADFLNAHGPVVLQGYFLSPPVKSEKILTEFCI